jgi:hypothetical protein
MQLHTQLKSVWKKAALAVVVLGGLLCFGGAASVQAHDRDDHRDMRYYDNHLRDAIEDHGYYSPQAEHWRHERHEALERREAYEHGWRDRNGCWHRY